MVTEDPEHKSNYFFDKKLKKIFKKTNKPLFGVEGDSYNSSNTANLCESSVKEKDTDGSLKNYPQENLTDVCSWKEFFFFSINDKRQKDGVSFFNSLRKESIPFNETRKKLKQCIRHKLSKRRNFVIKKKFNKRNMKRNMYQKI